MYMLNYETHLEDEVIEFTSTKESEKADDDGDIMHLTTQEIKYANYLLGRSRFYNVE